jgi:hypothetical protein
MELNQLNELQGRRRFESGGFKRFENRQNQEDHIE